MALKAVKHKFTGATTPITSYDSAKTNLGSLMVQNTGSSYLDKYAGPLPVGLARPMQEVVYTGNASSVSSSTVTGSSTSFVSSMIGMVIGFGSNDPAQITIWYAITACGSNTSLTITTGPTVASTVPFVIVYNFAMMYPHAVTYSPTVDWVFLTENSTANSSARRICLYEYNKTNSVYTWKGFINTTFPNASTYTTRGFRALRYLHTKGTVTTNGTTVDGTNTDWINEGLAVGARIGFGSTDPTQISTWYVISAVNVSGIQITLSSSAGVQSSSMPYVIEELRFTMVVTSTTATSGGLYLVKGINYSDFVLTGTTIPAATNVDNIKAVYWLSDAGTPGNIVTNVSACGCAILPETSKRLHYTYVLDGTGSAYIEVYRYNLRAKPTALSSGKMTLLTSSYTTGDVTVTSGVVAGNGTTFTSSMVGMRIGFGSKSPALITNWYIIASCSSGTSITLNDLTVGKVSGTLYIIDSADVICTGNELVTGTISAVNNGRIGTLNHGPGKGIESLYFATAGANISRIYRAAMSKIYAGSLDWISGNAQEVPTGGVGTFPVTNALSSVEIADGMDRLIVLSTEAGAVRNYVTQYTAIAGEDFDHIWGVDDKQQDQILAGGNAFISSGTVAVNSSGVVAGTKTFFTLGLVGFKIGFGTTDPTAVSTWYTIISYSSITSISLAGFSGSYSSGTSYVIDLNINTFPHFSTSSQPTSVWSENGIAHVIKHGATSALCQMYALPLTAHWTFASSTNQRIITPALYTPDCEKFKRVIVASQNHMGGGEFYISPESWRMYFRTKGIANNAGQWTLVDKDGDLSGLSSSRFIQFMFEFVTIGLSCIPARIMSLTVIYDDTETTTDSHFQPSMSKSSATNKQFAWRFATEFGSSPIPKLRVRIYNALTGDLLIDDNTVSNPGRWDKSTNNGVGGSWDIYNTNDKTNETTYIRYAPHSLYDNIKVRVVLTQ